jgi:hypothetical protein
MLLSGFNKAYSMSRPSQNQTLQHDRADWYRKSFYNLHLDHHTRGDWKVGRDADPDEIKRLVNLSKPDFIQIHAKGNPGWTTYPSEVGYTPPLIEKDVMQIYRDAARDLGIPFSAYYNLGRDGEIMKRRPEFNRLKLNGQLCDKRLSYSTGVAEEYLWPQIREIMKKYKPDGFWFDGSCFTVEACFQPVCKEQFRKLTGQEPPTSQDSRQWEPYKQMHRQIYRDFVHDTAAMIHRIDPKCMVAVNFAYAIRMPEKPDEEIDYLSIDIGNDVDRLSRYGRFLDTQGLPFDIMTSIKAWRKGGVVLKPSQQLQQEIALIIANGGRYFAWDNPTHESAMIEQRHIYMGQIAPWIRARQPWCQEFESSPDVSVLQIAEAHYQLNKKIAACFSWNNPPVNNTSDCLNRLHINHEIIADWRLIEGPVKGKLLIVENPCAIPENVVEAIGNFAHNGGKLLLTAAAIDSGGKLIEKLAGIKKTKSPNDPQQLEVKLPGSTLRNVNSPVFSVAPSDAAVLIKAKDNSDTEYPFLTHINCGKGEVFYCSIPFFTYQQDTHVSDEIRKAVLDKVLPPPQRMVNLNGPDTIEVSLRKKQNTTVVHLINIAKGRRQGDGFGQVIENIPPAPECHVSVKLPKKPVSIWLEPAHKKPQNWYYKDDRLEVDVPSFPIHQIIAINLK